MLGKIVIGLAVLGLFAAPAAMAHGSRSDAEVRQVVRQRADFDRDTVLGALALGARGSDLCDFDGLFPGHLSFSARERRHVHRHSDLDRDDVLAHLAFGRRHHRHLDDDQFHRHAVRYRQNVDLDRDDALLALALGCEDVFPGDFTVRRTVRGDDFHRHHRGFDHDWRSALLLRALL